MGAARLVAPVLLASALLLVCVAAATAFPSRYDLVTVEFTGDGYGSSQNGVVTDFGAGAFWEDDTMLIDTEHTPIGIVQADEVDSLFGIAFERLNGGPNARSCASEYQLSQALHPGTATAAGPRFWTQTTYSPSFGPAPGREGVLVNALPFFGDFERISGDCNSGNGPLDGLNTRFVHFAACVVQPEGECAATIRVPNHTVSCGAGCSSTYGGVMNMKVRRFGNNPLVDQVPLLLNDIWGPSIPYLDHIPLLPMGGPYPPPPPVILRPPKISGTVEDTVYIAKQPVLKLKGPVKAGARTTLQPVVAPTGALALQHIKAPTQLTAQVTFTPTGKPARTFAFPFYVLPRSRTTGGGSTPTITSVSFAGSAMSPTVTIHGKNLGRKPSPSPAGHPAGLGGCPVLAGDTGYDYGTSLYIVVPAKSFSGGRSRPSFNETDCLDLVVTRFTGTEVDFHFGPFYRSTYPKFALTAGTQVEVVVNGATASTTVRY